MVSVYKRLDAVLSEMEPLTAQAFRDGIDELRSGVVLKRVVSLLEAGDIDGAVAAMHLDSAALIKLQAALGNAYQVFGIEAFRSYSSVRGAAIRFDARNLRAEEWLRDHSSELVTRIIDEQRYMIRSKLVDGMASGAHPHKIALDIVGRVSRVTGKRVGGVIGLSDPQARSLDNFKLRLSSGDPAEMRKVLEMAHRDKRFDGIIRKAIAGKRPVSAIDIDRMAQRYADRALKYRGDMIGRTETLTSLNAASYEAFRQRLDGTNYTESDVIRTWDSVGDRRVRHTHAVLEGKKVRGLSEPFVSPSGARMRFPGDRSFGAGAAEIIQCRCRLQYKIDVFGEGV